MVLLLDFNAKLSSDNNSHSLSFQRNTSDLLSGFKQHTCKVHEAEAVVYVAQHLHIP